MKNLLKALITIIVLFVSIYEVYFLINLNKTAQEQVVEENTVVEEQEMAVPETDVNSGEEISNQEANKKISISVSSKNELMNSIDEIEANNNNSKIKDSIEARVGLDVIGEKYESSFKVYDAKDTGVIIQTAGTMINIIPKSDNFDRQAFHYDTNGNLVMYLVESSKDEFITRYYILNNKLVEKLGEDKDGKIYTEEDLLPKEVKEPTVTVVSGDELSGEEATLDISSGEMISGESVSGDIVSGEVIEEKLPEYKFDETNVKDITSRAMKLYDKYLK